MRYLLSDVDMGEEEAQAVADVVRGKWLSIGPRTAEFEAAFAGYFGVRHAVAVSSCTAALHLALKCCGVGLGDEVILPSLTFVATANAVLYQGATPVFVDITSDHDLNVGAPQIEALITPKTAAIIVVHFAGYAANMEEIQRVASRHRIPIVEDACHAIGARYQAAGANSIANRRLGAIGTVGCFSFFANKNLATGEGGMLVTDDDDVGASARRLRAHGMTKTSWDRASGRAVDYDVVDLGFNYRPTELTAALGSIQLGKLASGNQRRKALTRRYYDRLGGLRELSLPFSHRSDESAHHIMPILLRRSTDRAEFRRMLHARGVQTSIHYPPVHLFTQYQNNAKITSLPITLDVSGREVTLPLHPLLTFEDVDAICDHVAAAAHQLNNAGVIGDS